jgi:hypothetical protein
MDKITKAPTAWQKQFQEYTPLLSKDNETFIKLITLHAK